MRCWQMVQMPRCRGQITRVIRANVVALAAAAAATSAAAQSPVQRLPPRDARTIATGTASITGRVLAADTGRPLRRVRVTLTAPELGSDTRITSTNVDGRYEIKDLPPGNYTIQANRSGYLALRYGQKRPYEQGRMLELTDRQR